jgi:hypothetical protein
MAYSREQINESSRILSNPEVGEGVASRDQWPGLSYFLFKKFLKFLLSGWYAPGVGEPDVFPFFLLGEGFCLGGVFNLTLAFSLRNKHHPVSSTKGRLSKNPLL